MSSTTLSLMQKVELLKRIANDPNIPSPPTLVMRVLDKASQPECAIGDLCQIIQLDAGLSANILRVVNSATFGLSRPVTSIHRALAVVGLNAARLLVLAISFPKMQRALKLDPAAKQRYWKSSLAGAIVARELSQCVQFRDPEDDMAAGLLRDLGELTLQQLFPAAYQEVLHHSTEELINEQCHLEESHCGLDHAEVSAFILHRWRLPTEMTEAIRHHHHPALGAYSTAVAENHAYLLYFATRAAQLLTYPKQTEILQDLQEVAFNRFGMGEREVHEFLKPLSRKTTEFAALLQVDIGEFGDYQGIVARASEEFVNLTVATNLQNQRAQESTRRAELEAARWKQEASFDPLTKVFNRRFLEKRLEGLFNRPRLGKSTFGLLFIDLDGFKPLNDQHGHLFGDAVLQQVGDCLQRQVRKDDIVARYGGDEFCVLSETTDELGVQTLSRRIWEKINGLTVRRGTSEARVSASIGAVYCHPTSTWESPADLLAAADKAMYQAKTSGKNRVVFFGALAKCAEVAEAVGAGST